MILIKDVDSKSISIGQEVNFISSCCVFFVFHCLARLNAALKSNTVDCLLCTGQKTRNPPWQVAPCCSMECMSTIRYAAEPTGATVSIDYWYIIGGMLWTWMYSALPSPLWFWGQATPFGWNRLYLKVQCIPTWKRFFQPCFFFKCV